MELAFTGRRDFAYFVCLGSSRNASEQWYPTFFVSVHPDVISLQIYTRKVVGV
jgi:hypothetical protein